MGKSHKYTNGAASTKAASACKTISTRSSIAGLSKSKVPEAISSADSTSVFSSELQEVTKMDDLAVEVVNGSQQIFDSSGNCLLVVQMDSSNWNDCEEVVDHKDPHNSDVGQDWMEVVH